MRELGFRTRLERSETDMHLHCTPGSKTILYLIHKSLRFQCLLLRLVQSFSVVIRWRRSKMLTFTPPYLQVHLCCGLLDTIHEFQGRGFQLVNALVVIISHGTWCVETQNCIQRHLASSYSTDEDHWFQMKCLNTGNIPAWNTHDSNLNLCDSTQCTPKPYSNAMRTHSFRSSLFVQTTGLDFAKRLAAYNATSPQDIFCVINLTLVPERELTASSRFRPHFLIPSRSTVGDNPHLYLLPQCCGCMFSSNWAHRDNTLMRKDSLEAKWDALSGLTGFSVYWCACVSHALIVATHARAWETQAFFVRNSCMYVF